MRLPTVAVCHPIHPDRRCVINESDYDPDVHTLWSERDQEKSKPAPKVKPVQEEGIKDDRFASNQAEDLAAAYGLSADSIKPTGRNGKIVVRDVRALI